MGITWDDLIKSDLVGRDLVELCSYTLQMWRGPISVIRRTEGFAYFEMEWTALSCDGSKSWTLVGQTPVYMNTEAILCGSVEGRISIIIPGTSWEILPLRNNLPKPGS